MTAQPNPSYNPGLAGVVAGETAIAQVDPGGTLLYRGYDIHDLATGATFEDVAYLLIHGEFPTPSQSTSFRKELADQSALPPAVASLLELEPPDAHPIDVLRTAVSLLASFDPQLNDQSHAANVRKSVRLVAKIGAIVPAAWRIARKQSADAAAADDHDYAHRFLHALHGTPPPQWQVEALNTVLVLYAEHEFNASTFAARVTVSTLSDVYAGVTSALGTLKGPLHGGANEEAMKVLTDVGAPANAASWARDKLARHEKVMGFGHRVYRTGDSRVPVMRDLARRIGGIVNQPQWAEICEALEAVMAAEKGLCANVDLYAAPVLHMMGVPPALNTPIFACARAAGWCAHVTEQLDANRLIRPRSIYTGPARRAATKPS